MTASRCLIVLWIACLSAISVQSLDLASSQYPFYKANRERNNQLTGKILCSSIAPGRTTVFNDTWSNADLYADILPPMVGQDHFFLLMQDSEGNPFIRRYEIDGASNLAGEYPSRAITTILQDGSVALSNTTHSVVVSADLTTELFTPLNNLDSLTRYTSMIPVQGSYLLRPYDSADSGFISVLNLTNNIANAYWAANITCSGTIFLTMVYTPASGEDVLVVAADTTGGVKICAGSSTYTIPDSVINPWAPPFIADSALHLFLQNNSLVSFNLDTRTFTRTLDYGMGGFYNMQTSMMIRGSKALASLLGETVSNIIDVFSNQTILPKMKFVSHPTFSIPDNVVVIATDNFKGTLQVMALDWDTWEMKATGYFNTPNPGSVSEAVFDENCTMFVTTGDAKAHKLVPMPIAEIVPVIDCIDEFNRAYLTYQNNAQGVARIPYVVDRNALSPDNIAPVTTFNKGSGPHFPLSTRVQLQNPSATYQWRLEDYLLTFSVTPQLACPANVSLTLTFTATSFFDEATFVPLVVNTFISVTGVRDSRVSVLNVTTTNNQGVSKRDIQQGDPTLEMELEISGGNSLEPTSAEIVSNLVNNQYSEFDSQIASSPDAPSGTQVGDAVSKTSVNSQSGGLSPILPPVAPPTNSPISPPVTENTPQSNAPVRPTSSGSRVHLGLALTAILHLSLRLVPLHQQ